MSAMQTAAALERIYQEHVRLADQLASCAAQVFDAPASQRIAETLRELLVDLGLHFGFEESLMAEEGYADFDHHRRQHIAILTELALLLDRIGEEKDAATFARGMDFVAHWYRQHVAHGDQKLDDWLTARSSA